MPESEDVWEAIDYCYQQGWAADGLPVVPPTEERVQVFLERVGRDPAEVVTTMDPIHRKCTVEKAAINSVLAGCLPEYFPVVLAALEALEDERYCFHGSTVSTGGCAPLLVVNGPIRQRLGMNGSVNVFGPGFRPNATIGRAIRLIQLNVFGMYPGSHDQSTHGFPGKYSLCIAENEEESPWEPLHVEGGFGADSDTVTVWGARGVVQVQARRAQTPEAVLLTIVDTMCPGGFHSERAADSSGHGARACSADRPARMVEGRGQTVSPPECLSPGAGSGRLEHSGAAHKGRWLGSCGFGSLGPGARRLSAGGGRWK